ncbi:hypothetical protein PFICI_01665 [Pestalotiopsis fici W106-1]|uniref:N-acetyltransferase B complex non catalytic subunit n=1 Tax=Pestalotiopsis fici (strain W106-1 / CGMCC3.15140) TaxID=1229662 RepID=W3XQP6_PESFW|nr:uncharacterized protein PFICI_01665 [Pestalotiopsis fici W106-1]ETS87837.1 hypothetical protein PFICI_01665 [Pestalotiopsis fici W106-1]
MAASYYSGRNLPPLRPNCDANVQIAFGEGNWAKAITLAKQQFKRSQDPYYEAVELAARSELDTAADKVAAFVALEKIVKEKKPVKDHWTIELFEWATSHIEKDYSEYIGTLRVNFVKEFWKPDVDKAGIAIRSYWSCAINDDWESAQAIAATVDKKFPNESRHLFYNILAYHVLSVSLTVSRPTSRPTTPSDNYHAALLRNPASSDYPPRAITSEEELLLWIRVQVASVDNDDSLVDLLKKPEFDALKRLSEGFGFVFKEIMHLLSHCEAWREVFDIGQKLFDRALAYITESAAFQSAVMDGSLWMYFIGAASKLDDSKKALKQLRGFIEKVSKVTKVNALFRHHMEISNLIILFNRYRSSAVNESTDDQSTRVNHLYTYIVSYHSQVSCFDSIKPFLEQLRFDEVQFLLSRLEQEGAEEKNDLFKNTAILTLRLKIRYLMTTSNVSINEKGTNAHPSCKFCKTDIKENSCNVCLQSIAKASAWLYNQNCDNHGLRVRINDMEDVDPFGDLAIVGTTCLLKLSGLESGRRSVGISSETAIDLRLLMRAIAWMERHHNRGTQKGQAITLFLAKLYLLIGCVPQAHTLWRTLEVKNVTLDSLGPLFTDRLSTIAPGMWRAGAPTPMTQFHRYFKDAIVRHIPTQLRTALENGNYVSVLGLKDSRDRLCNSCTMIMTNVEDRRGLRAIGSKYTYDTNDDPLLRLIKEDKRFEVATDYAALPDLERAPASLAELISIGPRLSESRAKLSLYAEYFLSLVSFRESKEYKPAKPGLIADKDRNSVAEDSTKIRDKFEDPLELSLQASCSPSERLIVTSDEYSYFTTIQNLADLVALGTAAKTWTKSSQRPNGVWSAVQIIVVELQDQQDGFMETRARIPADVSVLGQFVSLHSLGMLRESIIAVKLTVNYLERVIAASKDAPKWLSEDCKNLNEKAAQFSAVVKQQIKALNDAANAPGWLDRIAQFTFGDLASGDRVVDETAKDSESSDLDSVLFTACGGQVGLEHSIGEIQESWREVAKGWNTVKLD